MSALFRKPKIQAVPAAPDPRDEEARAAAEQARRNASMKGQASTVLTRLMRARTAPAAGPATTLGGG